MRIQCTNTPVSWLELERYALGESLIEDAVREHLAECDACTQVSCAIAADERSMPALVIPNSAHRNSAHRNSVHQNSVHPTRAWWKWAAALVPVALLLVFWRSQGSGVQSSSGVKGDTLSLSLVRERNGVLLAPTHHARGDRFKARITCAPGLRLVDLVVRQDGALNLPIPTSHVDCGNATSIPGAFTLEGGVAEVCIPLVSEKDQGAAQVTEDAVCFVVAPDVR
jgi:hypothetical protein